MPRLRLPGFLLLAACLAAPAQAAPPLPDLQADPARTSVSGLSSGGFMAAQYAVAFSASTFGVGVIAGGPYLCTEVTLGGILSCMKGTPDGAASFRAAQAAAARGAIDPVAALATSRVYLFSGRNDPTVLPAVVEAVRTFYREAGTPDAAVKAVTDLPAGHAFLSPSFGSACGVTESPYITRCVTAEGTAYDQPAALLTHLYGPLRPAAETVPAPLPFDQTAFGPTDRTGLAEIGYLYLPDACRADAGRGCAVHVVFHGCRQSATAVGDAVYAKVGYNRWAESNRIIVLYPQVVPTESAVNPRGCWDWWGYSQADFAIRSAPQMAAIRAMVERLTAPAQP